MNAPENSTKSFHPFIYHRNIAGPRAMSGAFSRGAHTMNSMFKPMVRKCYHKKSSSAAGDTLSSRETTAAAKAEGTGGCCCWVPDEKTGIYYPKGQEKVMQQIPAAAGKDVDVHWYSHNYQQN